jgi:hypothetical protein
VNSLSRNIFNWIAARLIPTETASIEDTNITVEIVRFSPEAEDKSLAAPVKNALTRL